MTRCVSNDIPYLFIQTQTANPLSKEVWMNTGGTTNRVELEAFIKRTQKKYSRNKIVKK